MSDETQESTPWSRLDDKCDYRRYAAEIEVIRSALPAFIARNTVDKDDSDNNGRPIVIFKRASEGDSESKDEDWLLVWHVKAKADTKETDKYIGYITRAIGGGNLRLRAPSLSPDKVPNEANPQKGKLGSKETPWEGPCYEQPPEETTGDSDMKLQNLAQLEDSSLEEQIKATEESLAKIEKGYELAKDQPDDAQRWWRHAETVEAGTVGKLYEYLVITALREDVQRQCTVAEWKTAKVTRYELPFYAGYSLYKYEIKVSTKPDGALKTAHFVVHSSLDFAPVCALGHKSPPIHCFNELLRARNELKIDERTAAGYMDFFCRFVHGEFGPFWIVEGGDDFKWNDDDLKKKDAVTSLVEPIRRLVSAQWPNISRQQALTNLAQAIRQLATQSAERSYVFGTFINYGKYLVRSRMRVHSFGLVGMEEDEPCFAKLPVNSRKWNTDTHFSFEIDGDWNVLDGYHVNPRIKNTSCFSTEELKEPVRNHVEDKIVNFSFPKKENVEIYKKVTVTVNNLDFYEGYALYQITDRRGLYAKSCFVILSVNKADDAPACYLGHSIQDVLDFNKKLIKNNKLKITKETVIDYLAFYYKPYAQGRTHGYSIIKTFDDLRWSPSSSQTKKIRDYVEKTLEPVRFLTPLNQPEAVSTDTAYHLSASFCSRRDLGFARFFVGRDGIVVRKKDRIVERDIPIIPEIWDDRSYFVLRNSLDV